jgi:hypothetical protein
LNQTKSLENVETLGVARLSGGALNTGLMQAGRESFLVEAKETKLKKWPGIQMDAVGMCMSFLLVEESQFA